MGEREYVRTRFGAVIHVRDGDDGRTLCGRAVEGFGNDLDANLWARSPHLRCATCLARVLGDGPAPAQRREDPS
jgi:hypothetical protein